MIKRTEENSADPTAATEERLELVKMLAIEVPQPSPQFRRKSWREYQRALDPLAQPKPLPPRH
jgi:hypothetical protein